MEKEKKNVLRPVLIILAFIAYIVFSFRHLSGQLQMIPEWTIEITEDAVDSSSTLSPLPFKLGQNIGYFTHDGKITFLKSYPYKATISRQYFAVFDQNSSEIPVYDPKGNTSTIIRHSGFPYIKDDRFFIMLPGGAGFAFLDKNGSKTSIYEHPAPITALSSTPNATLAGFADGALCLFDEEGNLENTLYPAASDYNVILGSAISNSGTYFACVSGQSNQRFVLYKKENNHCKIIFHKELPQAITRQTLVYFSQQEDKVYFDYSEGMGIVDCNTFEFRTIKMNGSKILNIQESPVSNSAFVLSKKANEYTVTILESKSHKTGSFSYNADSSFILTDQNAFFVGKDNKISKFNLSKE
ncbi:MAG: hypothetical protein MJ169_04930 [Treponema sp.]|nr:hypothetical protein [Treponema sp.]